MTEERKPLAPDRPGLYELRNGEICQLNGKINDIWHGFIVRSDGQQHASWYKSGKASMQDLDWDIVARGPDDAAWCLAQAQLFAEAIDSVVITTAVYTVLSQTHKAVCTVQNSAIAEDAKKLRAAFLEHTKRNADEKAKP